MYNSKPFISYLDWDSEFFGIRCGKAQIFPDTSPAELNALFSELPDYDFVTIQNVGNSLSVNKAIAEKSNAYLVDVNIQFEKIITTSEHRNFFAIPSTEAEDAIMAQLTVAEKDFCYSKFVCDPEMKKRAGYKVYEQWLKNSRKFTDKYFVLKMDGACVAAYILLSVYGHTATLELVKVDEAYRGRHMAIALISEAESFAAENGCTCIKVGTQLNNLPAINLYHCKNYRETSRISVFHYWK